MADEVRVLVRKFDGSLHWHAMLRRLGEDEHGVWLGAHPGVAWRRGDEAPVTFPAAHVPCVRATASANWLAAALADREPFASTYRRWLG